MITGESGTGKELIARAIHEASSRRDRPLIRVNCAAIPRELFESEFFGHVRGAFTGAMRDRIGRFELADGGTLFLDEVGEIPLELQGKLLRVLQEGNFERVGEERTRAVDVRLIAATNRDLKQEVQRGRFREDLYFRLNVFPVESVPLRERREDIPLLAQHFLDSESKALKSELRLSEGDARRLSRYDWPGNVRELQNVIERAAILAQNGRLRIDLPDVPGAQPSPGAPRVKPDSRPAVMTVVGNARPRTRQHRGGAAGLLRQGVRPRRRRRDARHQADHAGLAHQGAGDCECAWGWWLIGACTRKRQLPTAKRKSPGLVRLSEPQSLKETGRRCAPDHIAETLPMSVAPPQQPPLKESNDGHGQHCEEGEQHYPGDHGDHQSVSRDVCDRGYGVPEFLTAMLRQIPLPQSKVRRQLGKGKRTEKSPPLPEQAPILCGGYLG